jgi:hypothetical protein
MGVVPGVADVAVGPQQRVGVGGSQAEDDEVAGRVSR